MAEMLYRQAAPLWYLCEEIDGHETEAMRRRRQRETAIAVEVGQYLEDFAVGQTTRVRSPSKRKHCCRPRQRNTMHAMQTREQTTLFQPLV